MYNPKLYEDDFRKVISNRIKHCEDQLKNNKKSIIREDEYYIFFKNGEHYSKPVMKALVEALTQDINDWNALVWQQIVRQLWEDNSRDKELFYIATEHILIASWRDCLAQQQI